MEQTRTVSPKSPGGLTGLLDRLLTLLKKNHRKMLVVYIGVLMLLCSVLLVLFFGFYLVRLRASNERTHKAIMDACLNFLVDDTEYLFSTFIEEPLDQINNSNSIIAVSYATSSFYINGNAIARVKSDLHSFANSLSIISDLFFYVPNAELVVDAQYSAFPSPAGPHAELIYQYENQLVEATPLSLGENETYIFCYNGQYYVVRHCFPYNGKMQSAIFLRLDVAELFHHMQDSFGETISVYIYDADGQAVFAALTDYPQALQDGTLAESTLLPDGTYISYQDSELIPWRFYLSMEPAAGSDLISFFPMAAVMVAVACLLSITVARFLYRPLMQMVTVVSQVAPPSPDASNELDYLNSTLSVVVENQNKLNTMMGQLSSDVLLRTLNQLLNGCNLDELEVGRTLNSIGAPLTLDGICLVAVLRYQGGQPLPVKQADLLIDRVTACLAEFDAKNQTVSRLLQHDSDTFAMVLQWPAQSPAPRLERKRLMVVLGNDLMDRLGDQRGAFAYSFGNQYNSLLDIGYSFAEAIKELDSPAPAEPIPEALEPELSEETITSVLARRSRQILEKIMAGQTENARRTAAHTVEELQELQQEIPAFAKSVMCLINDVVSLITSYQFVNLANMTDEYTVFADSISTCTSLAGIAQLAKQSLDLLIEEFAQQLKRQNNPYLVAVQQYIERHYQDPNLSLDEIAVAVGLSPSYLSTLFSEIFGLRLFEYINRFRLSRSMNVLLNTGKPINEIAEEFGFSSARSYIRSFKKYYNTTPGQYRKQHTFTMDREEIEP